MKSYKKMYMSSYSQENFYVNKFEMGADAYREGYDGINERLRIVSILSANRFGYGTETVSDNLDDYCCDYDYDAIFNNGTVTYAITFESDGEIDELPEIDEIIYC